MGAAIKSLIEFWPTDGVMPLELCLVNYPGPTNYPWQGPRNSGFNGFIWTHGFLETFEFNLLLFTEERIQGSELLKC